MGKDPALILADGFYHKDRVIEAYRHDRKTVEWLCEGDEQPIPCALAASRILLLGHLEDMSRKDPFQISRLIQVDHHYLYLTHIVETLVDLIPEGIDVLHPGSSHLGYIYEDVSVEEKRKVFADQMREIWWRPRTTQVKIPSRGRLFQLFYDMQDRLKNPTEAPQRIRWNIEPDDDNYQYPELEQLVKDAKVGWFASASDFAEAYENNGKLEEGVPPPENDDSPLERLVWALPRISEFVANGNFADAAIEVLACELSSTPGTILARLRENARVVVGVQFEQCKDHPLPPMNDHRRWDRLAKIRSLFERQSKEEGRNIFRELAYTRLAKSLELTRDEVEGLFPMSDFAR